MWVKATTLVALYHRPAMDEGLRDRRDRRADALAGENARVSKVVLGGCSASNHPPPSSGTT